MRCGRFNELVEREDGKKPAGQTPVRRGRREGQARSGRSLQGSAGGLHPQNHRQDF